MAVALTEVAKKAGVSIATASMAIRDHKKVSDKTRVKVKKVAKELGFRPNAWARALALGRAETLGVTFWDLRYLSTPYVGSIVSGIAEVSDSNSLGLAFTRSEQNSRTEPEYIQQAREGRFDGMIIIDQAAKASTLHLLNEMSVRAVLVDRKVSSGEFPTVRVDYRKAVKEATSYLIRMGHERIAVYAVNTAHFEFSEKVQGYQDALSEHGIPYDPRLIAENDPKLLKDKKDDVQDIPYLEACVEAVEALDKPPTAYMCLQDTNTDPLNDLLRLRGLRVPEDVSVIGFDSADPLVNTDRFVSVVKVPCYELGVRACQILLDLLRGRQVATRDLILDAVFEPRYSCAPPGR